MKYIYVVFIIIHLLINCTAFSYPELKLLNVIFRHGDRDVNDGVHGDLTLQGRQRAYHLGEILRAKYGDFLGDIYEPAAVSAQSTSYKRAKLSLQLLLAALYVPQKYQQWHESLAWQPIPFSFNPEDNDILLIPTHCPRFLREYQKVIRSEEYKKLMNPYEELLMNLTFLTDTEIKISEDAFNLYHNLKAMEALNETLPEWAKDIYPDGDLLTIVFLEYRFLKFTDWMNKVNGGTLLRRIVDSMLNKVTKNQTNKNKIFLYSTHELLMVALIQSLKFPDFDRRIPNYSSAIIVELREYYNKYYIKIQYYDGMSLFDEVQVPGCTKLCPLELFIETISNYLPRYSEIVCNDRPINIF